MLILGLQKLTLLDFPGRLACTVFLGGCNFRCPFCYNGSLVMDVDGANSIEVEDLLAFLDSRVGRLHGVCISGGEPTLHHDLPNLLSEIKARGFAVKLDTNGSNPEMLSELIEDGLVDYVAMDIKNSLEKYELTIGANSELGIRDSKLINRIKESAGLLMEGRVDFEFRTTLVRELHTEDDIRAVGEWLAGEEKFFLQTYRDEGDLIVGGFSAFTKKETEHLLSILKTKIPNAKIRG